ncbi:MAG: MmgE/PrpD family protein [Deltaproteobacteria bacterium]|nr:MmgE/PrpD family protein [Deltaproteobacteria bacterium]
MGIIDDIVVHTLETNFQRLPCFVVEQVKKSILDTIAVTIAGSSTDLTESLVNLVKSWGGREESSLLVFGGRIPASTAAMVNATLARARDLDDVHESAPMHVGAAVIPGGFAFAEYSKRILGKEITGKDFITAVTLGADFLCRLRLAGPGAANEGGWASETPVPLAVAMTGAKMFGCSYKKMLDCLGIAYAQCSGNIQAHTEGALTVRLQEGFATMSGVLSVMLAQEGFTGAKDSLEGKFGYYNLYMKGEYRPDVFREGLGTRYEISNVSVKPYPCCKYTHTAIFGALRLAEDNRVDWKTVKRVTIVIDKHGSNLCGGERKRTPQSVPEAQFSYYYTVASALVKGRVFIDNFTEEAIRDEDVLSMAKKIELCIDSDRDGTKEALCPVDISIETENGCRYSLNVATVKGHPDNPMSFDDVIKKLWECTAFSARPLAKGKIHQMIQSVRYMEEIDDVSIVPECIT